MGKRHFAEMYKNRSQHRHDQESDWSMFEKDMEILTGMLYTVASIPLKPFMPIINKVKRKK
jgi:hypothetical protein